MAISAISSRYAGFTFDGESSKTYGVYITDGGFYSAPIRDTEVVEIPGRNGAYILDRGRFKNIQVTYKAAMGADSKADFISGISAVRNWLCSKKGYVRLTDDFNPDEYRLATVSNGLEVSNLNPKTGEFDITFECMPQRFLTSGETAQTITSSGDTLTNPTRFNARPMLEVEGYGKIGVNGQDVEIISEELGDIVISSRYLESRPQGSSASFVITPDYSALNIGDEVYFPPGLGGAGYINIYAPGLIVTVSGYTESGGVFAGTSFAWATVSLRIDPDFSYHYGTPLTASASFDIIYGEAALIPITCDLSIDAAGVISIEVTATEPNRPSSYNAHINPLHAYSTKTALGSPLYLDLDIGEAYKIEGGEIVSVNSGVSLGAELPELKPGANEITFENTITSLKVIPRWWKV